MNCSKCGKPLDPNFQGLEPLCSTCLFWTSLASRYNYDAIIINGEHYSLGGNDQDPYFMQGHGGRKFTVRFFDGRVITTNNLWHQGSVPEHFRHVLRNNAEFV